MWKRFKTCPVCNSAKNVRCQYPDTLDFFQCRSSSDTKGNEITLSHPEILSGKWFCIGESGKERLVGYKHESVYQISQSTSDKLDRVYREFPAESQLTLKHYKHLLDRGLSEQHIKLGRFRSLDEQYCQTYKCGGKDGFDVPSWIATRPGKVNYQTRWLDNPNKYTWGVLGAKWNGCEMPLTYIDLWPDNHESTGTVYACEGLLKPYVAYCLSDGLAPFLGASGGMFAASQGMLSELVKLFGIKEIVYFPDKGWRSFGSTSENGVFRTVDATIRCFKRLGLTVKIADWGQWDSKASYDIDELLAEYGAESFLDIAIYSA